MRCAAPSAAAISSLGTPCTSASFASLRWHLTIRQLSIPNRFATSHAFVDRRVSIETQKNLLKTFQPVEIGINPLMIARALMDRERWNPVLVQAHRVDLAFDDQHAFGIVRNQIPTEQARLRFFRLPGPFLAALARQ